MPIPTKLLLTQKNALKIEFTNESFCEFDQYEGAIRLSIETMSESNKLFHEMFHAYQAYQFSSTKEYTQNSINLEIEAHYAHYVYLKRITNNSPKWMNAYSSGIDARLRSTLHLTRYLDENGQVQTVAKEQKEVFLDTFILQMKDVFKNSPGYENLSFNENTRGSDNFKNMRKLNNM